MSTYYKFKCNKCKKIGGYLTRQAWGWGNFDIVDSFRFLAKHIAECGEEHIGMSSEYDDYESYTEDKDLPKNTFPCSNDWQDEEKIFEEYKKNKYGE